MFPHRCALGQPRAQSLGIVKNSAETLITSIPDDGDEDSLRSFRCKFCIKMRRLHCNCRRYYNAETLHQVKQYSNITP
jgi:hypothetical protein